MHDPLDKYIADRGAGGLHIQHVEFRHHVAGDPHVDPGIRERPSHVIRAHPIAGNDDGTRKPGHSQFFRVPTDGFFVAAVGAACQ